MKIPSYLSVSSLNTWRRNPLFWVCKYSLGYRDVSGENAIRGIHVENAVNEWVALGQDESDSLLAFLYPSHYEAYLKQIEADLGITSPKYTEEEFLRFLEGAVSGVHHIGKVKEAQVKMEFEIAGYPAVGYVDYEFEDAFTDLKTTTRMPSTPSYMNRDHMRQISAYNVAYGGALEAWITYASNGKRGVPHNRRVFRLSDTPELLERAWESLERDAAGLLNFAERFEAEEAIQFLPATTEAYYDEMELVAWIKEKTNGE